MIGIRLTTKVPATRNKPLVGNVGLYLNDGTIWHGDRSTVVVTEPIKRESIVGCQLTRKHVDNIIYNACQFAINGENVGLPLVLENVDWYPSVSLASPGAIVLSNLGRDKFKYSGIKDVKIPSSQYRHLLQKHGEY